MKHPIWAITASLAAIYVACSKIPSAPEWIPILIPPTTTMPKSPYPYPVVRIDIKNYTEPRPNEIVVDATAKSCGFNPDFLNRECWPACGYDIKCDASLNPIWSGPGEVKNNPWQYHAPVGAKVKVCVKEVCAEIIADHPNEKSDRRKWDNFNARLQQISHDSKH